MKKMTKKLIKEIEQANIEASKSPSVVMDIDGKSYVAMDFDEEDGVTICGEKITSLIRLDWDSARWFAMAILNRCPESPYVEDKE